MVAESLLPHTRGRQTQAGRTVVLLAVSLLAVVAIIAVRPWAMPSDEPTELLDSILLPVPGGDAAEVSNLKSVVQGLLYRLNTLHDISAEWRQRVKSDVRVQRDAVFDIKQQASKVEKRPHQPWIPHATQVSVARSVSCSYHGWWCLAGRRSRSMPFPDNFCALPCADGERGGCGILCQQPGWSPGAGWRAWSARCGRAQRKDGIPRTDGPRRIRGRQRVRTCPALGIILQETGHRNARSR